MSQPRATPMVEDRISSLPDSVLCHILSFLLTKEAVATSILANRWNRLWLKVPTLDFDDNSYNDQNSYSRFEKSVYAIMLSRDLLQPIKKFRISVSSFSYWDIDTLKIWINAALQRRVEHIELSLDCSPFFNLPSGSLSCVTLVVLKLKVVNVDVFSSIHLPSLKILHLDNVSFSERRCITDLLAACPILEDIQATRLIFDDPFNLGEYKSCSTKLVRAHICTFSIPLEAVSNVEFLHLHEFDWDYVEEEEDIPTYKDVKPMFHNLTHIEFSYLHPLNWHEVVKVIEHCHKLQSIVIMKRKDLYLPFEEEEGNWPYPQSVPGCISLNLRTCCITDYTGSEGELRFARYIMENAKFLQTITILCYAKLDQQLKLEAIQQLSLCTRCSATCKLSFK